MAKIVSSIFLSVLLLVAPLSVHAARLDISVPSPEPKVGSTFTVHVSATQLEESVNAASGILSFPQDVLEVVSISKAGSMLSLFVQEPTFSNTTGIIRFEGIVLDPQAMAAGGKIISITFKAKAPGTARVRFSSGSLLANDGAGTNLLSNLGMSQFTVGGSGSVVATPDAPVAPKRPVITSPTHPDQTRWYANPAPEFSWILPAGSLEVKTLLNTSPSSAPTVSNTPPISKKKVTGVSDGTSYFHVQVRTTDGWGDTLHFRVNIDSAPPKPFPVTFPEGTNSFHTSPSLQFSTTDVGSGIARYEVNVQDEDPVVIDPVDGGVIYAIPAHPPGVYTVRVTAVDKAGNRTASDAGFTIEALNAPEILSYSKEFAEHAAIDLTGSTYADAQVTLAVKQDGNVIFEKQTESDADGIFHFLITHDLEPGLYTVTTRVADASGAQSLETLPRALHILPNANGVALDAWNVVGSSVTIAVLGVVLAIFVVVGMLFAFQRRGGRQLSQKHMRRSQQRVYEVYWMVKKTTTDLRMHMDQRITDLKAEKVSKKLAEKEVHFLETWRNDLAQLEEITKEVSDSD